MDYLNSKEVEDNIISLLISYPKVYYPKVQDKIKPEDFFEQKNRILFEIIQELSQKDKPIDSISIYELIKFKKQDSIISERDIEDLTLSGEGNIDYLIKTLIKYSKKRQVISLCDGVISQLKNNIDVDDVLLDLNIQSDKLISRTNSTQAQNLVDGVVRVMDIFERITSNDNKLLGVDTGFSELNMLLSGLCPSRFYILGARPSIGKSSYAQQIAETAAINNNVLFFSLEMGLEEYTQRSIYRRSGYNQEMLTRNSYTSNQIFEAFAKAGDELSNLKLQIIDDSSCTLSTIETNIKQCINKKGSCDLVIIDYIQLMKSDDKYKKDDYDIVTDNSKGLKRLARKYKIPILALSQLGRQVEQRQDKKPILSDLRDSGSIEQDADVVMFLYRPDIYFPTNPLFRNKAELIIAKNRQGARGVVIPMVFNGTRVEFKEMVYRGN